MRALRGRKAANESFAGRKPAVESLRGRKAAKESFAGPQSTLRRPLVARANPRLLANELPSPISGSIQPLGVFTECRPGRAPRCPRHELRVAVRVAVRAAERRTREATPRGQPGSAIAGARVA